jgi:HD-GYP domain-containing protein (c-di-GMP phosphodiesterase class II)
MANKEIASKLGVADDVLHKPGPLSDAEFDQMKRHASVGEEIVAQVRGLSGIATIVGQDHERWAGGGYPRGLAGEEILPEARLIAVADVFDAMTTDRPYRAALTEDDALSHLESVAGSQLDPHLTVAFVDLVRTPRGSGVAFCYCATH